MGGIQRTDFARSTGSWYKISKSNFISADATIMFNVFYQEIFILEINTKYKLG